MEFDDKDRCNLREFCTVNLAVEDLRREMAVETEKAAENKRVGLSRIKTLLQESSSSSNGYLVHTESKPTIVRLNVQASRRALTKEHVKTAMDALTPEVIAQKLEADATKKRKRKTSSGETFGCAVRDAVMDVLRAAFSGAPTPRVKLGTSVPRGVSVTDIPRAPPDIEAPVVAVDAARKSIAEYRKAAQEKLHALTDNQKQLQAAIAALLDRRQEEDFKFHMTINHERRPFKIQRRMKEVVKALPQKEIVTLVTDAVAGLVSQADCTEGAFSADEEFVALVRESVFAVLSQALDARQPETVTKVMLHRWRSRKEEAPPAAAAENDSEGSDEEGSEQLPAAEEDDSGGEGAGDSAGDFADVDDEKTQEE